MKTSGLNTSTSRHTIVVRDGATGYYAIYGKPTRQPALAAHGLDKDLTLLRRRPSIDSDLIKLAHDAAIAKARELGWIK